MGTVIPSLAPPVFVNDADGLDPNLILSDMIAEFEAAAGRTLQPAQVERLLINLYAYRESLVRNAIQYAGQQNLLAFASFPMIDFLGQLLGVTRLPSQPALTTIQFTLVNALTVPLTIAAAGLAVQQFALGLASKIQRDVVPSQIIAALSVPGVYEVELSSPALTTLAAGQWANCTQITLTLAFSTEHS